MKNVKLLVFIVSFNLDIREGFFIVFKYSFERRRKCNLVWKGFR